MERRSIPCAAGVAPFVPMRRATDGLPVTHVPASCARSPMRRPSGVVDGAGRVMFQGEPSSISRAEAIRMREEIRAMPPVNMFQGVRSDSSMSTTRFAVA